MIELSCVGDRNVFISGDCNLSSYQRVGAWTRFCFVEVRLRACCEGSLSGCSCPTINLTYNVCSTGQSVSNYGGLQWTDACIIKETKPLHWIVALSKHSSCERKNMVNCKQKNAFFCFCSALPFFWQKKLDAGYPESPK